MAELTNETVQRLNKVLEKLAKEKAKEKGGKAAGPAKAKRGHAREYDEDAQALEKRSQQEDLAELNARKNHAAALGRREETKKLEEDMERLRQDMDNSEMRRKAGELKRKVRSNDATAEEIAQLHDLEAALDEVADAADAAAEAKQRLNDQTRAGTQAAESWLNSALSPSSAMLGKLQKGLVMGKGGMMAFGASIMKSAASGELFLNMGIKLADLSLDLAKYMIDFALDQDAAISSFRQATGAGKEFNDEIRNTERRLFAMGVSTADAANATQALKNTFVDFTYLSDAARDSVRDQTLMLEKLGMAQQTSAEIYQIAGESMNMSVEESSQLLLDLTSTARSLGVDVGKMGQDFVANKEFIVSFGKDGSKVFEDLAKQAKALGMEIGTLTGVVDKFTTFDEAGKSVGRLNAILGGPFLNSIDMMNAAMEDPAEAINMLRDSFDQAGVSMEDMGRAEKMAFASALGMSIEDMTNMMGQSREEMEIARIEQEALAEQSRQTQKITDQLTSAMNGFYVQMGPIIEDILVPFIEKLAGVTTAIAEVVSSGGALKVFFAMFGAMFGAGIGLAIGMAFAMQAATAAIPAVGPALAKIQGKMVKAFMKKALASAGLGLLAGVAVGLGAGVAAGSMSGGGAKKKEEKPKPRAGFAEGGVVTGTAVAMVGERGPEMVEMPIGSRVTNAPTTQMLTAALLKLTKKLDRMNTDRGNIAVYVGDKEVTDIVVKAMNSSKAKQAISPYGQ